MKIHLADSIYWEELGDDFQQQLAKTLKNAYREATKLMPFGSSHLNVFVQPREHTLIDETHDFGCMYNSEYIEFAFSPSYAKKHPNDILTQARRTMLHEMNHAARYNIPIWHNNFLDSCILEGLATVFEREHCNYIPLWSKYPKEVSDWLGEIRAKLDTLDRNEYMFEHPDGRKWIGYKVGTYIVDEAMKQSGKSIVELTQMECADILALAGVL